MPVPISSQAPSARGFTLVEVLLTLCLIVVVTSLAWPVLDRPFAHLRLKRAAEDVRGRWAGARVEAMDSGQTYVFRYAPGSDRFRIERYAAPESQTQESTTSASATSFAGSESGSVDSLTGAAVALDAALPDGIVFGLGQTEWDTRSSTFQPATDSTLTGETDWAGTIYFYPDGTTSNAVVVLKNQFNRSIQLSLRGLTGTVNIGDVYTAVEDVR